MGISSKKYNHNLILYTIIFLLIVIILYNMKVFNNSNSDSFLTSNKPTTAFNTDGTQLYGSLFLDNLNDVIINMTDPPIKYDTKRIELIRYSDVLL